jgi:hypothetical protein
VFLIVAGAIEVQLLKLLLVVTDTVVTDVVKFRRDVVREMSLVLALSVQFSSVEVMRCKRERRIVIFLAFAFIIAHGEGTNGKGRKVHK